ncbi:MAG: hypothetical protein O4808_17995 [Trichodesmium sp. St17_bin3_1_1]|nr:hypothetical protein [Trichodesmium sp. St17_bin3_1_1]
MQISVWVFSFYGAIALFSYQLSEKTLVEQVCQLYRLFHIYRE